MSKERLEGIEENFMEHEYDFNLKKEDIKWLIKQAERVEKLQLEVNDWRDETIKWNKRFEESEESHSETKELLYSTISENKRYREAIEVAIRNMTASGNLGVKFALRILEQALECEK